MSQEAWLAAKAEPLQEDEPLNEDLVNLFFGCKNLPCQFFSFDETPGQEPCDPEAATLPAVEEELAPKVEMAAFVADQVAEVEGKTISLLDSEDEGDVPPTLVDAAPAAAPMSEEEQLLRAPTLRLEDAVAVQATAVKSGGVKVDAEDSWKAKCAAAMAQLAAVQARLEKADPATATPPAKAKSTSQPTATPQGQQFPVFTPSPVPPPSRRQNLPTDLPSGKAEAAAAAAPPPKPPVAAPLPAAPAKAAPLPPAPAKAAPVPANSAPVPTKSAPVTAKSAMPTLQQPGSEPKVPQPPPAKAAPAAGPSPSTTPANPASSKASPSSSAASALTPALKPGEENLAEELNLDSEDLCSKLKHIMSTSFFLHINLTIRDVKIHRFC